MPRPPIPKSFWSQIVQNLPAWARPVYWGTAKSLILDVWAIGEPRLKQKHSCGRKLIDLVIWWYGALQACNPMQLTNSQWSSGPDEARDFGDRRWFCDFATLGICGKAFCNHRQSVRGKQTEVTQVPINVRPGINPKDHLSVKWKWSYVFKGVFGIPKVIMCYRH